MPTFDAVLKVINTWILTTLIAVFLSHPLREQLTIISYVMCRYNQTLERRLDLEMYDIHGDIYRLDCNVCKGFLAMKLDTKIVDVNSVCSDKFMNTWKEIETNREKLIYYVLSQIIYIEYDTPRLQQLESPFGFAHETDVVILRWVNGEPIGFYTIKPKGTEVYSTQERYIMPVLDTAYIKSKYRRKGYGLEILSDIVSRFPSEDIGFSKPISEGMLKVLKTFLTKNKEYRLRFWEIADCDISESQQLIWYRIRN